jgi:hypothetical protein
MGRWDIDDAARSPDRAPTNSVDRADATRRDHELTVTALRDRVSPRSREEIDGDRGHGLTLPEAGIAKRCVTRDGRIVSADLRWNSWSARRSTA